MKTIKDLIEALKKAGYTDAGALPYKARLVVQDVKSGKVDRTVIEERLNVWCEPVDLADKQTGVLVAIMVCHHLGVQSDKIVAAGRCVYITNARFPVEKK